MKDIKKSDLFEKLDKESEEKVSGGYINYASSNNTPCCDNCLAMGGIPLKGGGHLCMDCLEKLKGLLSSEGFEKYMEGRY